MRYKSCINATENCRIKGGDRSWSRSRSSQDELRPRLLLAIEAPELRHGRRLWYATSHFRKHGGADQAS